VPNFLARALDYGRHLSAVLDEQAGSLRLCHFRDPWSGIPILDRPDRRYATVYEVNGLPSIELPYTYPRAGARTLAKIRAAEERCWTEADQIITPSRVLRDNLVRLGAPAAKITVIPNGADLPGAGPPPPAAPDRYILYFGALQPWQGVDVLLRAFALLADLEDLWLVVCAATPPRQARGYRRLAAKLGVAERVHWLFRLPESELAPWRAHARLSVAPLTECSRNLDQGCCPLKILESMASGVPVVASDLPVTREIIADGVDGRLVRAERPAELARVIRVLLDYPDQARTLGEQARRRIARDLTWDHAVARLTDLYHALCPEPAGG
jgi:glycosyltransferase involved in cell wall biosynthesis